MGLELLGERRKAGVRAAPVPEPVLGTCMLSRMGAGTRRVTEKRKHMIAVPSRGVTRDEPARVGRVLGGGGRVASDNTPGSM